MALILRQEKGQKLTIGEADGNFTYLESLIQEGGTGATGPQGPEGQMGPQGPEGPEGSGGGGGGGLAGTQYIFVAADGTPVENALELQAAYNEAKNMSPTVDNRITVIAAPGKYAFDGPFTMDTQYIDLVSLTGNRDVIIYHETTEFSPATTRHNIVVEEGNILVRGVDATTEIWVDTGRGSAIIGGSFHITGDHPTLVCDNCQGGAYSFGGSGNASGTFTNCQGGFLSFGGSGGTASGTFTNCQGDFGSFGGNGGAASGTFTNCQGGVGSFGNGGGTLTGRLYFCRLTAGIYPMVSSGGITVLCIDGNNDINTQYI